MSGENRSAKIIVREFEKRDSADLAHLWKKAFPNDPPWNEPLEIIRRKSQWQKDLFLVGEKNGLVVAAVLGGYDGFRGWVYHLAVDAEWRGLGIGRKMMAAIEQRIKGLGCPKINLQVRSNNHEVVEFYKHLGYDVEDHTSMGKVLLK